MTVQSDNAYTRRFFFVYGFGWMSGFLVALAIATIVYGINFLIIFMMLAITGIITTYAALDMQRLRKLIKELDQ